LLLALVMIVLPPITEGAILVEILLPFTDIVIMEIPQKFIIPIVLLLITFIFTGLFGGFSNILTQRVLLDVIPNRIRNSIYSLMPTVAMLLALKPSGSARIDPSALTNGSMALGYWSGTICHRVIYPVVHPVNIF